MKQPSKLPDISLVEAAFEYDPIAGLVFSRKTGKAIGANDRTTGYRKVRVGRVTTQVSRLAWLLYYREDPVGYAISHIDGNKQNDSIKNLRKVKLA